MRRLGQGFCEAFPSAVLNIHPSLLPAFPGTDAQRQAVVHGVKISGATVHFVTPELDAGPIVAQRAVPVLDDDTAGHACGSRPRRRARDLSRSGGAHSLGAMAD